MKRLFSYEDLVNCFGKECDFCTYSSVKMMMMKVRKGMMLMTVFSDYVPSVKNIKDAKECTRAEQVFRFIL